MKTCNQCTRLADGLCARFGKAPPSPEYADKCRHYEHDEAAPPERTCADCERYDRDELGEWCLFHSAADCITFKPLPLEDYECPLS